MVKRLPPFPVRFCLKKIGPGSFIQTRAAQKAIKKMIKGEKSKHNETSKMRLVA
jgi:hypothetical protein